ncbi:MAG: hypothetical protein V3T84_10565 [Phycisphaerales bacterium]
MGLDLLVRTQRYWCGKGFQLSYGMCRIAICLAMMATFREFAAGDIARWLATQNPKIYDPVGILGLFGGTPPPAEFFVACQWVFRVSVWLMALGLLTRTSSAFCVTSLMTVVSLKYSFSSGWSHGEPPVLLPALALLFGPKVPVFSLDYALRHFVRKEHIVDDARARRAVLLGQCAIALILFNAALYKIWLGNQEFFAWVYSDSLRNILIYQYWVLGQPLPDFLEFVASHTWAYKGAALGNMLTQTLPLAACFLLRRPILRALCGLAFAVETLALGAVMQIWNPHWLLLCVFFIDWDWLSAVLRRRFVGHTTKPPSTSAAQPNSGWRQLVFPLSFVALFVFVAFIHREQRRYTFPFTAFPMYSIVYDNKPFGQHKPYYLFGSQWRWQSDPPLPPAAQRWVWTNYYSLPWGGGSPHETVKQITATLQQMYNLKITGVELSSTIFEIAPFPETEVHPGATAKFYAFAVGNEQQYLGTRVGYEKGRYFVELNLVGFDNPNFQFAYFAGFTKQLEPLPAEREDSRWYFSNPSGGPNFLVVWVTDAAGEKTLHAGQLIY